MQRQRLFTGVVGGLLFMALLCAEPAVALATPPISSSNNYQMVDGDFAGSGGQTGCSGSYCAQGTAQGVGEQPLLEVTVDAGTTDLGTLTSLQTAMKTATVTIRNYLSYGYTMQLVGYPPKYGNHTITTPSVPTASKLGSEQFGINVVKNTTPAMGENAVQEPAGGTVFGEVNPDYAAADKFMYKSGDVIAHGVSTMKEVGQTTYTISMIMNISNVTPAGHYTTDLSVVVVPIY